MPDDYLYVYSDLVADPVLNAILIAPAAIKNGISPKATKEVRHSKINAITSPVIRQNKFWNKP